MFDKVKDVLKSDYALGQILKRRYEHRFLSASDSNLFYGIYPSFDVAISHLPSTKPGGYDNQPSALLYQDRCETIHSTDYPALYWLKQVLKADSKVFEIGGHVGVSFYAYDKFMDLGETIDWTIHDVEAVVKQGLQLAEVKQEKRLHFTSSFQAKPTTDIVFASGSLQYIEAPLHRLMEKAAISPEHILVNLMPVNDKPDYYTINNIGTAFCPYKITNRNLLIKQLSDAGYQLVDSWENPNKRCIIPYQDPDYSLNAYAGFYFRKTRLN